MTATPRRRILALMGGAVAGGGAAALHRLAGAGAGTFGPERLRPPGAGTEAEFLAACIRCGQCVEACPYDTLRLADVDAGLGAGAPYLVARETPCHLCPGEDALHCIRVCPTPALTAVDEMAQVRMGTARLNEDRCWAYHGTICRACWHACPLPDQAIRLGPRLRPYVDDEACVGCGLCEHVCPTEVPSIVVEPPAASGGDGSTAVASRSGFEQ